jgi:hypothetical protein
MNPPRMSEDEARKETRAILAVAVIILAVLVLVSYQYFFG